MTSDETPIKIGKVRRIIGDILLVLMLLLSVEIIIDMFSKMFLEATEGDVQKAMVFELLICWVLFLTVFDIRFSIFTWTQNKVARIVGWILRVIMAGLSITVVVLSIIVIAKGLVVTKDSGLSLFLKYGSNMLWAVLEYVKLI